MRDVLLVGALCAVVAAFVYWQIRRGVRRKRRR
jgi:hypothetical protein